MRRGRLAKRDGIEDKAKDEEWPLFLYLRLRVKRKGRWFRGYREVTN